MIALSTPESVYSKSSTLIFSTRTKRRAVLFVNAKPSHGESATRVRLWFRTVNVDSFFKPQPLPTRCLNIPQILKPHSRLAPKTAKPNEPRLQLKQRSIQVSPSGYKNVVAFAGFWLPGRRDLWRQHPSKRVRKQFSKHLLNFLWRCDCIPAPFCVLTNRQGR